jgi:transposase-like protein
VNREVHAPFCGSPGARFPRATRLKAYREKHAEDEPPLQLSERARLRELEREVRELRMKADFLSKAAAYFAAEHR